MKRFILIAFIFFVAGCAGDDIKTPVDYVDTPIVSDGEILFKNNCASCHKVNQDFTGPALRGALERWDGDKKAMYDFIRNSAKSVVENAYAKQLFEKWNRTIMTPFNLSDAEIGAIMKYCENK